MTIPFDSHAPEPSGSAAQRVYADLRERIVSLALGPDTTLSRGTLAAQYGVSQTPVRDALQKLEQEGLVRVLPQSRTYVARIDIAALEEAQFLRVAVETEVVRRLALAPAPDLLARLRSLLKLQGALVGDVAQAEMFSALDREFHRTMFAELGQQATHAHLQTRLGHLTRCQKLELPRQGKMEEILAAHTEIVDGIAAGDPERAADAMRRHLSGTIRRIARLREEHPAYFV
jgi:DNA-binding GntR family transcriptional regulator